MAEGLQVNVIGESDHVLGGDPAFGRLAVLVHVFDEQAFSAVDGFAQLGRQVHALFGPHRRVINADEILQRFADGLERIGHCEEQVLHRDRIRQRLRTVHIRRHAEILREMLQAVRRQFIELARHQQRVDQVGKFDGPIQFAVFVVKELDIELGIVTDDHRVTEQRVKLVGDL